MLQLGVRGASSELHDQFLWSRLRLVSGPSQGRDLHSTPTWDGGSTRSVLQGIRGHLWHGRDV